MLRRGTPDSFFKLGAGIRKDALKARSSHGDIGSFGDKLSFTDCIGVVHCDGGSGQ